jgi:hypothetical protein
MPKRFEANIILLQHISFLSFLRKSQARMPYPRLSWPSSSSLGPAFPAPYEGELGFDFHE